MTVPGFKKYVRAGLQVEVAGTMRVDAALEVGSATETVTVRSRSYSAQDRRRRGEPPTSPPRLWTTFRSSRSPARRPASAPANSLGNIRNPLSAVQLLPGARITTDTIMRINGMPSNSQSINIEGQDATNGFFKQQNQVNQAGVEAIQEVAIQTSNFAAEYGQAGGGYFNYTMKSGTNQLHGSGYDYFVNEALNAGTALHRRGHHESGQGQGSTSGIRSGRTTMASRWAGRSNSEDLQRSRQDVLLLQLRAVPSKRLHQQYDRHRAYRGPAQRGFQRGPTGPPATAPIRPAR